MVFQGGVYAFEEKQARPPQPEEREKEKIKRSQPSEGNQAACPDQRTLRAGRQAAHRTAYRDGHSTSDEEVKSGHKGRLRQGFFFNSEEFFGQR